MNGALPKGSRKQLFDRLQRYEGPGGQEAIAEYVNLARRHGLEPAHMALAFAGRQPFMTSVIIGATTMEQLTADIEAVLSPLDEGLLKEIDAIHRVRKNPCP